MRHTRIAFFDVDGTLTTDTTLFRFLRHYLTAQGHAPHVYEQRRRRLKAMTAIGVPREETNRAYFENFRGASAATVSRLAREWFAAELRHGGFFNEHALAALRRHQSDGDVVVLVSGSFPACLEPIAAYLGTDETWCTPPEITRGRYTGRLIRPPMIGRAKAEAVRLVASAYRTAPGHCVAYGDHVSDVPMLSSTGSAAVVGGDEELRDLARARSWLLLPGAPAPLRSAAGAASPVRESAS
ncbi:HAD-IB family hydrolase [Streptomyces sp. 135]|uniref:HAD family hydrolase n=1 Tax=Streptomyces sp. 135 TaxID=2838850 RepID=UPI001CBE2314|nr:HAD-IB family hydrolase [Streptomyces sp. 135]